MARKNLSRGAIPQSSFASLRANRRPYGSHASQDVDADPWRCVAIGMPNVSHPRCDPPFG